jgi:hypothetical protein
MSGGSLDYVCYRVEDAANRCPDPEFSDLLKGVADVLHDMEWWMSADIGEEEYLETLGKFKRKWFGGDRAERLRGYVDEELELCRERCYRIVGSEVPRRGE